MNVLLCPLSDPGFRYPAVAVGQELRRRGHDVQLLGPETPGAGLPTVPAAEPGAFLASQWHRHGIGQYRSVVEAARASRADVLVTSVLCHGALVAAEVLDIPVAVLGLAAHLWPYRGGARGGGSSGGGPDAPGDLEQREWRLRETYRAYSEVREQAGLAARAVRSRQRALSGSGLLLRGHPDFEVPDARLPAGIHRVGPCSWEPAPGDAESAAIGAALDRVGKPVVYVHLGRTFGRSGLWPWVNETFTGGPYQAVVELGRSGPAQRVDGADVTVVRQPWLAPLVRRSCAVVTNGTTAPALAALLADRPLLLAPEGSEQFVLAAACLRAGTAVRVPETGGAAGAAAVAAAEADPALRRRVGEVGTWLRRCKSEAAAADFVEGAVTGR
jgi:UDP:flavonoid glycosyltransferase YjiC (YdhE family)